MTEKSKGSRIVKIILLIIILVGLIVIFKTFPVKEWLVGDNGLITWIEQQGTLGYLIFIGVYILLTVLAGPAWLLTIGAGLVYGLLGGTVLVSIGSILGATAAFLIGRYLARDAIARKVEQNAKFKSIDEAVGERGFFIVFLTRLSPIFPFTLLNYAYGLTKVNLSKYFFATWIGMLPGTVMYVYIGSLGNAVTEGATTGKLILKIAGFVATVAVTIYITKVAHKALSNTCVAGECLQKEEEKETAESA